MDSYYSNGRQMMDHGDFEQAVLMFKAGLENDDVKCAYGMVAVSANQGTPMNTHIKNLSTAIPRIIKLAEDGDSDAHFILGRCYETGTVFNVQINMAVKHYSIAADKGNSDAMFNLGCVYIQCGLPLEDVVNEFFRPAAELGSTNAQLAIEYYVKTAKST